MSRTNTTTLENKEFQDQALKESALENGENLKVDVVFVMDMTGSILLIMQRAVYVFFSISNYYSYRVIHTFGLMGKST